MTGGSVESTSLDGPSTGDFTERLVDGFFRHWLLYLLPVVLFAALGVVRAADITGQYVSEGRLSATTNPYLSLPTIRGTEIGFYETPASGTSRLINEQLQTEAFIEDVAQRAGLTAALDSGLLTTSDVRSHVGASAAGDNNLRVGASWDDAQTAQLLAASTIAAYTQYLAEVASQDSAEAVKFWTARKADADTEVLEAQDALDAYLRELPPLEPGADRSTEEELTIQRLNSSLDRALTTSQSAQDSIDQAEFAGQQAQGLSARELRLIDPPRVPANATAVRRDQAISFMTFALLGTVISACALVVGTAVDHSVRTAAQIKRTARTASVVTVPRVKRLGSKGRRSRRKTSGGQ